MRKNSGSVLRRMERLEGHLESQLVSTEEQIHRMIRLMPDAELDLCVKVFAELSGRDPKQPASPSGIGCKDLSPAEQREALQYVQELHRIYLESLRSSAVTAQDGRQISS